MKKLLVLGFVLLFMGKLMATDASFNITMHLIAPIAISVDQDLSFPAQNALTAGTYTVTTSDSTAAEFTVTGDANAGIALSLEHSSIDISNGTDTIHVDTFTGLENKTLNASGSLTFNIGATATVENTDSAGDYSGNNTLTVVYQ